MPTENPRTSDRIEREIRRMITTLEIPPGSIIREVELTERLHCSRTPLREALQRLAEEYIVVSHPRRGMIVAELGMMDYLQLIEALAQVESAAAGLAADRADEQATDDLEAMINHAREANQAGDLYAVIQLDFDFHQRIALATENRYLVDFTGRLHQIAGRFSYAALKRGENAELSIGEHRQILSAIRRRDAALARRQTTEHTLRVKERTLSML